MDQLTLDLTYAQTPEKIEALKQETLAALKTLKDGTGAGNDYIGWVNLPVDYDVEEFERIKKAAAKVKKQAEVFVCIGIGGSYLGTKAVVDALTPTFPSDDAIEIVYAGNHLSSSELYETLEYLKTKDFVINVISKSGTTTEPAIAFRLVKALLESKYSPEECVERIYVTTDKARGALKTLANQVGYETFVVPDDVGGRYSFLTAVGLLPIACAGYDIDQLMAGARAGVEAFTKEDFKTNAALQYAATRNSLYREGKAIELLVNYEPKLATLSEWWKQLYGESEGKDGKGIYPGSANFTTDLHSLGQIIQDGERNLMETVVKVETPNYDLTIEADDQDLDGLNYLAGKTVDYVNKKAAEGTLKAHVTGKVPNIGITIPKIDEYSLGYLMYFFELACGVSGYMLGVNPFNQPGVEEYKKNMFQLLGKPGY